MSRQTTQYDPVFGYRFIPGLKARVPHETGGFLLATNEAGFRSDRAFAASCPPGRRRVLVFGDSMTAGDGVANAHRWTDLIEASSEGLEVFNFGLSGSGTDQQYLIWRECAAGIEHDMVVLAVFVENIRRIQARYRTYMDENGQRVVYAKPYFELNGDALELRHVPPSPKHWLESEFPASEAGDIDQGGRYPLLREIVTKMGARDLLQRVTRYQPVPEYDNPDHAGWLLMRAILKRWIQGIPKPVMLMPIPMHQHVEGVSDAEPYRSRFRELATATGCLLHDPLPDLQRYPEAERRAFRFPQDPHPTRRGHEVLAASLRPALTTALNSLTSTSTVR
jgi:hypothetical protein